jgi:hypothetical protein
MLVLLLELLNVGGQQPRLHPAGRRMSRWELGKQGGTQGHSTAGH